mmetsp:Transcript_1163/g.4350  ORF Transcript_1163/g.4350 Transcript_1163/m.4350 type:complete len:426 (+) Transcript_1163:112-1389(+)
MLHRRVHGEAAPARGRGRRRRDCHSVLQISRARRLCGGGFVSGCARGAVPEFADARDAADRRRARVHDARLFAVRDEPSRDGWAPVVLVRGFRVGEIGGCAPRDGPCGGGRGELLSRGRERVRRHRTGRLRRHGVHRRAHAHSAPPRDCRRQRRRARRSGALARRRSILARGGAKDWFRDGFARGSVARPRSRIRAKSREQRHRRHRSRALLGSWEGARARALGRARREARSRGRRRAFARGIHAQRRRARAGEGRARDRPRGRGGGVDQPGDWRAAASRGKLRRGRLHLRRVHAQFRPLAHQARRRAHGWDAQGSRAREVARRARARRGRIGAGFRVYGAAGGPLRARGCRLQPRRRARHHPRRDAALLAVGVARGGRRPAPHRRSVVPRRLARWRRADVRGNERQQRHPRRRHLRGDARADRG